MMTRDIRINVPAGVPRKKLPMRGHVRTSGRVTIRAFASGPLQKRGGEASKNTRFQVLLSEPPIPPFEVRNLMELRVPGAGLKTGFLFLSAPFLSLVDSWNLEHTLSAFSGCVFQTSL